MSRKEAAARCEGLIQFISKEVHLRKDERGTTIRTMAHYLKRNKQNKQVFVPIFKGIFEGAQLNSQNKYLQRFSGAVVSAKTRSCSHFSKVLLGVYNES